MRVCLNKIRRLANRVVKAGICRLTNGKLGNVTPNRAVKGSELTLISKMSQSCQIFDARNLTF